MAGAAAAERMGANQAGAIASAGGAGNAVRGNPPVPLGGDVRGAQSSPNAPPTDPSAAMDQMQQDMFNAANQALGIS